MAITRAPSDLVNAIFSIVTLNFAARHRAAQAFHSSFKRCRYDLSRWRTISSLTPQQTAVLDADDGAGWELAEALLRPRKVQVRGCSSDFVDISISISGCL